MAIIISNKVDFQPIVSKTDGERHIIIIKGEINYDEISILNNDAQNARAPTLIKELY